MEQQKKQITLSLPKLDSFDLMSILLWVVLLLPSLQLPSNATYTFVRSILFLIWTAILAVFVAVKIYKEKRMLFYSATKGNLVVALTGVAFIISLIFSASRIDSLYGFDLTFTSSSLVLLALVMVYFILKLAGLSLELAVSRVLSVLPFTLVLIDLLSIFAFIIPTSVYDKVFGGYSLYISHLTGSVIALIGTIQSAIAVHIAALIIVSFQLANALKGTKVLSFEIIKRGILALILTIMTSMLLFASYAFTPIALLVLLLSLFIIAGVLYSLATKQRRYLLIIVSIILIIGGLLGFVWNKMGIVAKTQTANITAAATGHILQQSYLNASTPMWRQLTGFGVGTFPYLYLQYRNSESALVYGNTTYFYKPNNFISELFVENGILGILAFAAILITVGLSYLKSSAKSSLTQEIVLLVVLCAQLLLLPSTLITLVLFFITLAAFFDKVESLPELLPAIRAVDIKESLYTNRSVSRGNLVLVAAASIFALWVTTSTIKPTLTMFTYARALQRVTAAQQDTKATPQETATALMNAYNTSISGLKYCKECSQLNYLNVNILLTLQSLYNSLPEAEREASTELRQVKNLLLQAVTDLIAKNPSRYEYWLAVGQSYRTFADTEKATSFYVLAVQSVTNALAINTYSIDGNYLFIDVLLGVGNDSQINAAIENRLAILKQIVGTPIQEQMIEGILAARLGKYDDSLLIFTKIKSDVATLQNVSEEEKKQLTVIVDQRMAEVTKLKNQAVQQTAPTTK